MTHYATIKYFLPYQTHNIVFNLHAEILSFQFLLNFVALIFRLMFSLADDFSSDTIGLLFKL